MTPTAFYCTQECLFCWRAQSQDLQIAWNEMTLPDWDSPEVIVEGSIKTQELILSGYGGNPKTDPRNTGKHLHGRTLKLRHTCMLGFQDFD